MSPQNSKLKQCTLKPLCPTSEERNKTIGATNTGGKWFYSRCLFSMFDISITFRFQGLLWGGLSPVTAIHHWSSQRRLIMLLQKNKSSCHSWIEDGRCTSCILYEIWLSIQMRWCCVAQKKKVHFRKISCDSWSAVTKDQRCFLMH